MNRATDVAVDFVEARTTNFALVIETSAAAGWPDRKLVAAAAAGEAEVILRVYLVSVTAIALSDLRADTAESSSKVAVVEA